MQPCDADSESVLIHNPKCGPGPRRYGLYRDRGRESEDNLFEMREAIGFVECELENLNRVHGDRQGVILPNAGSPIDHRDLSGLGE